MRKFVGYILAVLFTAFYIFSKFIANIFSMSALVTFNEIGDGVIETRMQFVRNGEKADMLMFMREVYDALGEECITVRKIK